MQSTKPTATPMMRNPVWVPWLRMQAPYRSGLLLLLLLLVPSISVKAIATLPPTTSSPQPTPISGALPATAASATASTDPQFQQGKQQLLSAQFTAAQQTFETLLNLRRQQGDRSGEAAVLNQLGETYTSLNQSDRAEAVLQQALKLWSQLNDSAGKAEALLNLGIVYESQEKYPQALALLQQALSIQQQRQDPIEIAKVQWELGAIAIKQGNASAGLEQLQQGLKTLQAGSETDPQVEIQRGRLLAWVGLAQINIKQPEAAWKSLQEAVALNRKTGDRAMEAGTLYFIGIWHANQKEFDPALTAYQQALAISEPSGDRITVGNLQRDIASMHQKLKQYSEAIAALQQALAIQQALGNRPQQMQIYLALGQNYDDQEQYPQAVAANQQALAIAQSLSDLQGEQQAFNRLGHSYKDQGLALKEAGSYLEATTAFQQALTAFQQSYQLAQQIKNPETEGWAVLTIGTTYVAQGQTFREGGNYQKALTAFQQALDPLQQAQTLGQTLNNPQIQNFAVKQRSLAYSESGAALSLLHQTPPALAAEQQSLAVLRVHRELLDRLEPQKSLGLEAKSLDQIGQYYQDLDQATKAIPYYQEAIGLQRQLGNDPAIEVRVLTHLYMAYDSLSQYPQALEIAQQALAITQQHLKDPSQEVLLLSAIANTFEAMGKFAAAIKNHEQALAIAKQTGEHNLEVIALDNLGNVYESQGQYKQALNYQQQALAINEAALQRIQAGDKAAVQEFCHYGPPSAGTASGFETELCLNEVLSAKATALNNVGVSYNNLGRYAEALKLRQEALEIAKRLGDRDGEATNLNNLGVTHLNLGNYPQALDYFQQALAIVTDNGNRARQSMVLNNIGEVYAEQGQYTQSLEYRQKALAIAQTIDAPTNKARVLSNIGTIYGFLGDHQRALDYFQQARQLLESLGVEPTLEIGNIGFFYENQGDWDQARTAYQRVLTGAQANGDRQNEAVALGKLANVDWLQGQYAPSLQKRQQAQKIYEEIGDRPNQVLNLNWLGRSYRVLGQFDHALALLQQALKMSREMGNRRQESVALIQIALVYQDQKQFSEAIATNRQALALARNMKELLSTSRILVSLGTAQVQQGQVDAAIAAFEQALAIQKQIGVIPDQAITLRELGLAYAAKGDATKGIATLQQALALHQQVGDRDQEGITLSQLGSLLLQNHQAPAAETALRQAADILDSLRSGLSDRDTISLFDTQTTTYRLLQQALIAQNKPELALEAAERGRARAFVALLTQRQSLTPLGNSTTAIINSPPPTLAQIQQVAQAEQATLVEYSIIDEQTLYIWVISPRGQISFRSVDLQPLQGQNLSLAKLVAASRCLGAAFCEHATLSNRGLSNRGLRAIAFNDTAADEQTASLEASDQASTYEYFHKLQQILIQPIADFLPTDPNAHVIFLPQGDLFLVPFVALQDDQKHFLIEQHTILTAPSIQVLQFTRAQGEKHHAVEPSAQSELIVGNPTMPQVALKPGDPPVQLPALPGTEQEAEAIAQLWHTQPLLRDQATKAAVLAQMPTARLIHLATHGILADLGTGIPGAIALAPAGSDQGLLSAEEILNLRLQADLVVLSACDTGLGKITGDGVIGLSRALMTAGAPSLIVSLWSVPDAPTANLMTSFYQTWQQNPDKAQALRQAMLATMHKHPEPRDWAAFTLIGETH